MKVNDKKWLWKHTWTKLLVMRCWYFNFVLESLTRRITVWSSTRMLQLNSGHSILWLAPSSMILADKYWVQQVEQKLWQHSRPVIICKKLFKKVSQIIQSIIFLTCFGKDKKQMPHSAFVQPLIVEPLLTIFLYGGTTFASSNILSWSSWKYRSINFSLSHLKWFKSIRTVVVGIWITVLTSRIQSTMWSTMCSVERTSNG